MKYTISLLLLTLTSTLAQRTDCNRAGYDVCLTAAAQYESTVCIARFHTGPEADQTMYTACQCYRYRETQLCSVMCQDTAAKLAQQTVDANLVSACAAANIPLSDLLQVAPWDRVDVVPTNGTTGTTRDKDDDDDTGLEISSGNLELVGIVSLGVVVLIAGL
jgi:hypothetical protein